MPPGCPEVLAGGMPNLDFLCCCVRRYDDDVGGPGHVVGDDGIALEPLSDHADSLAEAEAERLFELLENGAELDE